MRAIFILVLWSFSSLLSAQSLRQKFEPKIETAAFQHLDSNAEYFPSYLFWLKQFPFEEYKIIPDHGQGAFFLDTSADVIKNILNAGGFWEQFMLGALEKYIRPGSIVIDVGAHIGTHVIKMSRCVGPKGKVLAFEPQPKTSRELFMNLLLNGVSNVMLYPFALGAEERLIELSPLTLHNEGGTGLGGSTGQFVLLKPLDDFHLQNVSLIKVDVEGMEDDFLEGAQRTILINRPVLLIEIMGGLCYETASLEVRERIEKTIARLHSYQYTVEKATGPWSACWDYVAIPKDL